MMFDKPLDRIVFLGYTEYVNENAKRRRNAARRKGAKNVTNQKISQGDGPLR